MMIEKLSKSFGMTRISDGVSQGDSNVSKLAKKLNEVIEHINKLK